MGIAALISTWKIADYLIEEHERRLFAPDSEIKYAIAQAANGWDGCTARSQNNEKTEAGMIGKTDNSRLLQFTAQAAEKY